VKPGTIGERSWAALPAVLLTVVAATQIVLTQVQMLSPWKGGGFGMFSTLDERPFRYVRMFVRAPERSEELAVPPSLEELAASAEILPGDLQLERLARAVVAREQRRGQPAAEVRLEVWRVEFAAGSLAPRDHLLRRYEFRAAP
jgi:hypothetical protein